MANLRGPRDALERLRRSDPDGLRFVPFWSHRAEPDGSAGRGCLSQWWVAAYHVDGVDYLSAEHWMMAKKARLFGDRDTELRILAAATPAAAKRLGREVAGFETDVWTEHRFAVVVAGNLAKFAQHRDLRAVLEATGDAILLEASPDDAVWGIGLAADHPDAGSPRAWPGLNLLGFALMEVRARLRDPATGPVSP